MSSVKASRPASMTSSQKKALAAGRAESRIVRDYLQMIDALRPRRGRRRSPESMTRRLEQIEKELPLSQSIERLHLIQERITLRSEIAKCCVSKRQQKELEQNFIKVAKSFSNRHHISTKAWMEFGVQPRILQLSGLAACDSVAKNRYRPD